MTSPGAPASTEKVLREARKLNDRLTETIDELEAFVQALAALNTSHEPDDGGAPDD